MPREYKPVEVKALQWAKVYKAIESEGATGIAIRDLSVVLGFDLNPIPPELEKAIGLLQRQGRIRLLMGRDRSGMVTRVVQPIASNLSRRELLGDDDDE